MKKFLTFLCVLTCVLSLTACGETKTLTDVESQKVGVCQSYAEYALELASAYGEANTVSELTSNYNKQELAYFFQSIFYSSYGANVEADLGAFEGLLTTYVQSVASMGGIVSSGASTYEISKDLITINIPLVGNECDGNFKISFTNDVFTRLVSAEVSADTSFAQKMSEAGSNMGKAGLNTLLGMGTVFIMLILISLIISLFKLLGNIGKKKAVEAPKPAAVETVVEEEELSDDTELVAVIMAAISAYEGNGSTDGFVVRSIKRANRRF
ncbi:MAG: OadG family protein [Lachnospiraceae bacterium]|nr:OadG family protein [Lachnospiraceae bacterium]